MIYIYIIFFLLCLWKKDFKTGTYMAMDRTTSVKGFFVLLVFLAHFRTYVSYTNTLDTTGNLISSKLGQLIVVAFMLYSGYGVYESFKRKGAPYIHSFPKKRIFKTLVHFDIAVLLFLAANICLGIKFNFINIMPALIGWTSIGNSNWYIFAVLVLYLFTWAAFIIFNKHPLLAITSITMLTVIYILIVAHFRDYWWYDTVLCYPLGMWFSHFRTKLEKLVTVNNFAYLVTLAAVIVGFQFSYTHYNTYLSDINALNFMNVLSGTFFGEIKNAIFAVGFGRIFGCLFFAALILLITLKVDIYNPVLNWFGKYTFEIYILQRLPMMIFKSFDISSHVYLYFITSFAATCLIAVSVRKLTDSIDKVLFKPVKPK